MFGALIGGILEYTSITAARTSRIEMAGNGPGRPGAPDDVLALTPVASR